MSRDHAHERQDHCTYQTVYKRVGIAMQLKKGHWLGMWDCKDYNLRLENHKEQGPLQRKAEKRGCQQRYNDAHILDCSMSSDIIALLHLWWMLTVPVLIWTTHWEWKAPRTSR